MSQALIFFLSASIRERYRITPRAIKKKTENNKNIYLRKKFGDDDDDDENE